MIYDALKVALADPERRLKGYWDVKDPRSRPLLKQLGDKLVKAVRFDLDDGFTVLVEKVSLLAPRKVAYMFSEARAPYDLMWVEYNIEPTRPVLQEWVASRTGFPAVKPRPDVKAALLIERETRFAGRDSVYRLTSFAMGRDGGLVCWPVGVVWDPIQDNVRETMGTVDQEFTEAMWAAQPNHMVDTFGVFWAQGFGTERVDDEGKDRIDLSEPDHLALGWMTGHCRYFPAGAFGLPWLDDTQWANNPREKRFRTLAYEGTGDMRFTAALLGLMNTYEIVVGPATKLPHAKPQARVVWGKKVPYLEYHRLSIKLPKGRPIEARVRDFSPTLIHKRAHLVRGHNRYYRRTGKRVWIKPHQRGDASLGFVKKDYLIESSLPERKAT